jgi:asparagine synthase (glutamine-hydrolysing)
VLRRDGAGERHTEGYHPTPPCEAAELGKLPKRLVPPKDRVPADTAHRRLDSHIAQRAAHVILIQRVKRRLVEALDRGVETIDEVALARAVAPKHSQQKWAKLPDVLKSNGDLLSLYQLTYALFRPDFYEQLVNAIRDGLPDSTRAWLSSEIAGHDAVEAAAILETRCFVGERLLRDADTVSASLSMELRSPLSDARIIEAINRLPVGQKFMPVGFKPLLRRHGLAGLDPKLFDRPKSGFVLPFDRWIRKNLGTVMDSCMRDEASLAAIGLKPKAVATLWDDYRRGVPGIYWTRVWAIYVITRWCQRYGLRV